MTNKFQDSLRAAIDMCIANSIYRKSVDSNSRQYLESLIARAVDYPDYKELNERVLKQSQELLELGKRFKRK